MGCHSGILGAGNLQGAGMGAADIILYLLVGIWGPPLLFVAYLVRPR
jgi:hypothetical protein